MTSTSPVVNNPSGPDIVVSEIGDSPELFRVAALDRNSGAVPEYREYAGSSTGSDDSCVFGIFEAKLELGDFYVTVGDIIDTLRIVNNGQPGCCAGAHIDDIWVADAGGIGLFTPIPE